MLDDLPNSDIAKVMRQICSDDRHALAELYSMTSAQVYGALCRLLHDQNARNQAVIETYHEVWNTRRKRVGMSNGHLEWILAIAHRQGLRAYYSLHQNGGNPDRSRTDSDLTTNTDVSAGIHAGVLGSLDKHEAILILGSYLDGRSAGNMAQQSSVPKSEVVERMVAIVNKLRERSL